MRHTWSAVTAALVAIVVGGSPARALTLDVQGSDNGAVGRYRWLVEEDTTHPVTIGALVSNSLGVSIHKGYAPAVAAGSSDDLSPITNLDPAGRYFISILVDADYGMGGAMIAPNQSSATIVVNRLPIPTAQMLIFVFEDNKSISGAAEIPAEHGLANFSIRFDEILGHQVWDVFGNPLGTTYVEPLPTDGSPPVVATLGNGIVTGPDGFAVVKNLPPGNYRVTARPQDGQPWIQTTAIGGGPFIPVVIKAGEPPFFNQGLGVLSMHVAHGFVRPFNTLAPGTGTITGRCVDSHSPHPPGSVTVAGRPIKDCIVGLNTVESGTETGKYVARANADGTFTISNVPPAVYQIALWDEALGNLITNRTIDLAAGQTAALGDVTILRWTATLEGSVFRDDNADGIRQNGEPGIPNTTINIRYRDASIIQSTSTDDAGNYELSEVPPLGKWTIAEVDYARAKVTGATFSADQGADRPPDVHTETEGLVLLESFMPATDQVSRADWGKKPYGPGENGGIVGITYYAETRAEDDPYLGVGDPWEPGIPRVRVNLYLDANRDGLIDDLDGDNAVTLADVDNFPYDWMQPGGTRGPEDIDRNNDGVFDPGDAVSISVTDSFDDAPPTGCAGGQQIVNGQPVQDCAETLQTWNQLRPGVFDGGYYFPTYVPGGLANVGGGIANWDVAATPIANTTYIVEAVPPAGYEIVKEEDKNVTIGDTYSPSPQALLFPCVGRPHLVDAVLSGDGVTPGVYANQIRPLCDRKQVTVTPGLNANCDFFLFTHVPKAGRIVGEVQNLLANQTNPNNPNFGGPLTPSWMPISIQDYAGHEISRVYTDEFGEFNAMVPSSYSPHVPQPSGLAANVVTVCVNHPGPVNGQVDPRYDPNFDQPCLPVEIIPAKTTYVIMAVSAISAFASAPTGVDCELTDGTPVISIVNGPGNGGPIVNGDGDQITITSPGSVVLPSHDPNNPAPIDRNYGFGTDTGRVTVGGKDLVITGWSDVSITAQIPIGAGVTTGELLVERADGRRTVMGVTLTVNEPGAVVYKQVADSIQTTIDNAPANALILVPPGTYHENLIVSKPVRLQGYGAWSTIIDASDFTFRRDAWVARLAALVTGNLIDLIPGQRADLGLEDGGGITVFGKAGDFTNAPRARIDGLTVTGAIRGGGIFVNGYAPWLEISNVRLDGNQGSSGGGIRLGWNSLVNDTATGYERNFSDHIAVHHNHILRNGSLGDGGGILIYNGSDHYALTANRFCGNYSAANGGAISHFGLSDQGLIAENEIILNDGFGEGGGISLIGEFVPAGAPPGFLNEGVGSVTIDSNRIQSNWGGDDGGGITIFSANGQDVALNPGDPSRWWRIDIVNNMIVNNLCGFSGAGIAISDAVAVRVVHNTIADNDNTSYAAIAGGGANVSTPLGAGVIARPNNPDLATASGVPAAMPLLVDNIIWHNRSFIYDTTLNGGLGALYADPTSPYWDVHVFGMPAGTRMDPQYCLLSEDVVGGVDPHNPSAATPYGNTNTFSSNAGFLAPFLNTISVAPNLLTPTFSPVSPTGDYHVGVGSAAVDGGGPVAGNFGTLLAADFDADARPVGVPDIGADEVTTFPTTTSTSTSTTSTATSTSTTSTTVIPGSATFQAGVSGPAGSANVDTNVRLSTLTTNYGTSVDLYVGVTNGATKVYRTVMAFNLAPTVPPGAVITGCTLTVNVTQRTSPTAGHVRRLCGEHWLDGDGQGENQATWNVWSTGQNWGTAGATSTASCASGGDYTTAGEVAFTPPAGTGLFTFPSLTALCQDAVSNRAGWLRLRLSQDSEATQSNLFKFASSETGTATQRPKLVVTWTAAPPATTTSTTSSTSTSTSSTSSTSSTVPLTDAIGPKIRDLAATPNPTGGAASVAVTATAYDSTTGGSAVVAAEWWTSLNATPTAIGGSFGGVEADLAFPVTVPGSDFTVFVRARDAFDNWGATASILVQVTAAGPGDLIGPSINALAANPNPTDGAPTTTVTATVFDTLTGNNPVIAAEYWTTTDLGPGNNTPMLPADGTFNSAAEKVTVTIPASGPDFSVHVRGRDAAGNWGAQATLQVRVTPANTGAGAGRGIFIQCPGDADGDAVIDTATTSPYGYPSNARCKSLSAGDGHVVMGDGRPMFILGFSDLTGVPPDQAMAVGVSAANFPAPKIIVDEDDDFYLNLTNVGMATRPDLFDPHSVHWHGFPNAAAIFDGLPDASIAIGMGSTLTYFYRVKEPGTYMYHCHVEAAEHMQMGMLGNLYVRPKQNRLPDNWCFADQAVNPACSGPLHHNPDYNANRNLDDPEIGDKYAYDDGDGSTRYDVDYAIQIGSFDPNFHDLHEAVQPLPFSDMRDLYPMLNGRGYPDTVNPASIANPDGHLSQNDPSVITATANQKILLRISNLNVTRYYTLATLGIRMKVVGFNARLYRSPDTSTAVGKTLFYDTNSVTLGGGETVDVVLDTTGVTPGKYFLYTTNLNYLANNEEEFGGMMTEITVLP